MKIKLITLFLFFFFTEEVSFAQYFNSVFNEKQEIDTTRENNLYFSLHNYNVMKNNEYFGEIYEGFTLVGYILKPRLVYYPTKKIKIEAGGNFLKYSGLDEFTQKDFLYRLHYKFSKNIDIVIGNIYGSTNHQLIEPLYNFDRHFTNNTENGVQYLANFKHLKADVWIDWQKFIFLNSPFKEELNGGISSKILLNPSNSKFNINIPLQAKWFHRGGQIDTLDIPLLTIFNSATALELNYNLENSFVKQIGGQFWYSAYKDMSGTSVQKFTEGNAIYPQIYINTHLFNLNFGYWKANTYLAPQGEPLFQSVSLLSDKTFAERRLLTGKLDAFMHLARGITMSSRFEYYYDINNQQFEFSYALHVIFMRDFFVKKVSTSF